MKSYTITVNGTAYDVTVEENRKRFCIGCSCKQLLWQHQKQLRHLRQQHRQQRTGAG